MNQELLDYIIKTLKMTGGFIAVGIFLCFMKSLADRKGDRDE